MNMVSLAAKNLSRNKFRNIMTVLGVAVAIVAFVMIRTVINAWNVGVDAAAKDRIATRHKVSFVMSLPKHYIDTVRGVRGVQSATWANWFGAKEPNHPNEFFATMAVDPESFLTVYDEMILTPEAKKAFLEDRTAAVVGDVIAKKMGWHVGDKIVLQGTIYPGDWTFNVAGIYKAARKSLDRSQVIFHWDYLNESLPESRRDQIGWIIARVDNPAAAASITQQIDRLFDTQDNQTLSMSERALNNSFMAMSSALFSALDIISVIILLILLMILGNTVAMGVRERTNEYGVLRALGFLPHHVRLFIFGEATLLGMLSGAVGLLLAYPIVELGMGRFAEENMGAFFPYFRIAPATDVAAFLIAIFLGLAAAFIPAMRASRLTVTDALRRID